LKLYEQIAADLEEKIRRGDIAAGEPLQTEVDLAKAYGVSRSTVRQALSRLQQLGLITREVGRGTFVRSSPPESVHLAVYDDFSRLFDPDDLFMRLWKAVAERMHEANVEVHAVALDKERPLREVLLADYARGTRGVMLITFAPVEKSDLYPVIQRGLPLVLLNRYVHGPGVHSVTLDDFGGMRAAVHHLNIRGHRRIALVNWTIAPRTTFDDRIAGYRRAMEELGLAGEAREYEMVPTERAAADVLKRAQADGVTALACVAGYLALEIRRTAVGLGIRIPEQMSLVGFGDRLRVEQTGITHVDYRTGELGRTAAEAMLALVAGRRDVPGRRLIPTRVVEGETVAPPPAGADRAFAR